MNDKWLAEYDVCSRLGQQIMEAITDRNRQPRDSTIYVKKSASIQTSLLQFGRDVSRLRETLSQSAALRRITEGEIERRQTLVDELLTKQKRLDVLFTDGDQRSVQRTALFGNANPFMDDSWSGAGAGGYYAGPTTSASGDLTIDQIRQQQEQLIREQDQGLDALSRVVGRQKQIALDIGNEVESQNDIIDDIADHVDTTNTRLLRETQHVRVVDRKVGGTCWMYVVIVLLLIAIIVIASIPFH